MDKTTEQKIAEVRTLYRQTPEGVIADADTILVDLVEEANGEESALALEILDIWEASKDKSSLGALFYAFTDYSFDDYLAKVIKETTKGKHHE